VVALLVTCLTAGPAAGPAVAEPLPLPQPLADDAQSTELCGAVGSRPDRCLVSFVPGPVRNDEVVLVALDGAGRPAVVELEQRLTITGEGDYAVRERGPARMVTPLEDLEPPVAKFGAVVWQGFSPGERELAARLLLDPLLEAQRLPLSVTVSFTPAGGGAARPLEPGGRVPAAGTVTVTFTNTTTQPAELPTAADAPAGAVATLLDALLGRAIKDRQRLEAHLGPVAHDTPGSVPTGTRLPAGGSGLPAQVDVRGPARVSDAQSVALNLVASLTADGTAVTPVGPGATAVPGGARLLGTLPGGQQAQLSVEVAGPAVLALGATAVPAFDPRPLTPPGGAASWRAWAAADPDQAARRAALDLLVATAAAGARASSFSPYLGADLPGTGSTVFRVSFATPEALPQVEQPLRARRGPIAVTAVALLLLLGHGALLWRRS
jgi:hypothetical protein